MQTELLTKRISAVGEEIPHELGAKMIQDYQKANPTDVQSYIIGKDILNRILKQPGCDGIRFINAYNEKGQKTLVYVGIDQNGSALLSYQTINTQGILTTEKGIVADRLRPETRGGDDGSSWWDVE